MTLRLTQNLEYAPVHAFLTVYDLQDLQGPAAGTSETRFFLPVPDHSRESVTPVIVTLNSDRTPCAAGSAKYLPFTTSSSDVLIGVNLQISNPVVPRAARGAAIFVPLSAMIPFIESDSSSFRWDQWGMNRSCVLKLDDFQPGTHINVQGMRVAFLNKEDVCIYDFRDRLFRRTLRLPPKANIQHVTAPTVMASNLFHSHPSPDPIPYRMIRSSTVAGLDESTAIKLSEDGITFGRLTVSRQIIR
jgi:hypothetical protein